LREASKQTGCRVHAYTSAINLIESYLPSSPDKK
jgi:hypothetical protein